MIYKVEITLESKMTEVPSSSKIFGYIFGNILKNKQMKTNEDINQYLSNISNNKFNISNLMPKGYVTNPTLLYFIDTVAEEFTTKKSIVQKKVKKEDYISVEYLVSNHEVDNNKLYLKVDENTQKQSLKSYQTNIAQHVQINTLTGDDPKPQPFNLQTIETDDTKFEFYIEFDDMFKADLDQILDVPKEKLVVLGAQSGKGYNLFSISPNAITSCEKKNSLDKHIILSQYIVSDIDELKSNENANQFKLKNGSARPVRLPKGVSNDTRYRYFYIEQGSVLSLQKQNCGKLLSYYQEDGSGYDPKLFGKPFAYPVGGLNEVK